MMEQSNAFKKYLVESGQLVAEDCLGLSHLEVKERVSAGRLFALGLDGRLFYPAFFSAPDLDLEQLGDVCLMLGKLGGAEKWQFFTRPKNSLAGKTPLQALKDGELELVIRAVNIFTSI
mgnify:CR=1 FL=1